MPSSGNISKFSEFENLVSALLNVDFRIYQLVYCIIKKVSGKQSNLRVFPFLVENEGSLVMF